MKRRASFLVATLCLAGGLLSPLGAATTATATQLAKVKAAVKLNTVSTAIAKGLSLDPLDQPNQLSVFKTCSAIGDCDWSNGSKGANVVIMGDSHAYMWSPAIETALAPYHVRVRLVWLLGCPVADVKVWGTYSNPNVPYTTCSVWRTKIFKRIASYHPSAVILTERTYDTYTSQNVLLSNHDLVSGLEQTIRFFTALKAKVVVIGDDPAHPNFLSPPQCLSQHLTHATSCAVPVTGAPARWQSRSPLELQAAAAAGASFVDTVPWLCAANRCPAIIGGFGVYQDWSHVRAHYALALAPVMAEALVPALGLKH